DDGRRRPHAYFGDLSQADRTAVGSVQEQATDVGDAVSVPGDAPDVDVEGPAASEDVPDLLAGDQGGRGAPDVSRLDPEPPGGSEVDPDLNLGHVFLEAHVFLGDPRDVGEQVPDLVRPTPELLQILAEDPHDDGLRRSREDL